MNRRWHCSVWFSARAAIVGVSSLFLCASIAAGEVLVDDKWADGSRAESKLPGESAVWAGREADVKVKKGALATAMTPASQKIWTYFTAKEPVTLKVGQKLRATVSFIPRGELSESTSRSLRIGVFHDPTSPRVEKDVNNDGGGPDAPWTDATGYAVQTLVTGGEYSSAKPFDLGRRVNLESKSLLGVSDDYSKVSGGDPVSLAADKEYTITLDIDRISESQNDITATFRQGERELSTWTVTDDGDYLGTDPPHDKFDLLFIRLSNKETLADQIEFTNFKVEVLPIESRQAAVK